MSDSANSCGIHHFTVFILTFFLGSVKLFGLYDSYKRIRGFEPLTNCLEGSHSTTELNPQVGGFTQPQDFSFTGTEPPRTSFTQEKYKT
jgi:hypothetical protein